MRSLVLLAAAGAVAACGAAPAKIEMPPCGFLCGHAIYNNHGFAPSVGGYWNCQRGSPFDLIERTVKEEQGNLMQFWFGSGSRPLTCAAWLDLEEVGFKCPQPDWKNLKNLRLDEFPEFAKYRKERAGAGVARAIRMCDERGIYAQLMYVSGVSEKYTKRFTESPHYVGYDFGERFSFRPENGGNEDQTSPRLDRLADNLVASVRRHCAAYRKMGYGNIWCTSSNFFMDYEVYGGVDYTLFEDFTCDLNVPSALSRGLARQYGRELWGGHIANEHYAWLSYHNPHFFRMLYSAMMCKYVAGAKVIVSESGGWHTQTTSNDSPLNDLPRSRPSYGAKTPPDAELAPIALKAEKMRDTLSEEGFWSKSYRAAMRDFYRYVKRHGTPAGQPEPTLGIAKGHLDLEGGWLDGRPKANAVVAGMHPYAERHMEWMTGAPEFGWSIANEVFWPRGRGIFGTKDQNRLFSGTPYGAVDIVSFAYDNVTAEYLLKNYKTLAFVGWNTCSPKQYKILCDYVKGGGRLLISIPQLSTDVTRNYQAYTLDDLVNKGDFTELCGLKVVGRGPYFYWTEAVKGTSAEKWSSSIMHGAYRGILGKVEVANPKAEPLLYNWENDMNVLYRLPSGKGEVWFFNSWYYPGAYNHSYGQGAPEGSLGFFEDILRELARRSRGTAWVTECGTDAPGGECAFVNWSYFPSTKEVLLFNVDFEKPHALDLHIGGRTEKLVLKPQEIRRVPLDPSAAKGCPFKAGERIAFLGDSITQYASERDDGWVMAVERALNARVPDLSFVEAGVAGNTSRDMAARFDRDVLAKKPDWMFFSCGVNDTPNPVVGNPGYPLKDYRARLNEIFDKCDKNGIRVICLTATPVLEAPDYKANVLLKDYNAALKEIAAARGYPVVEIWKAFDALYEAKADKTKRVYTDDGTHLGTAGHKVFAETLLSSLK